MKKNGFVSTSLIYSFFIIFLLLMIFLLNSYSRVRFLLEDYKYDIKEDFASLNEADINVYIMVWNHNTEEYELESDVPSFGYVYESEFSYCKNGSTVSYVGGNISVTASRKDSCYVYFKELERDIVLKIWKKELPTSEPELVKTIPSRAYELTEATCTNGATINFNETTRKFKISSSKKTVCDVTFTKKEMDIIINVYKEDPNGTKEHPVDGKKFTLVKDIPGSNYSYKDYKCKNDNATITFDRTSGELLVDSSGKDECDVYFVGGTEKVEIVMMQESSTGVDGYTSGKKYVRIYSHPSSSYAYVGYKCNNTSATITYSNGIFTGESDSQTTCYVYFNKYNTGTAIINYYLEKTDGTYESVTSVPEIGYIFDHGNCKNNSSYQVHNNYVEVSATTSDEVCNFYYNQLEADIKVLVYVMNRTTGKYELGSVPVVGYEYRSGGCTNGGSVVYNAALSSLVVSNDGPTICTVYFR